jgi:predicted HicB family RNase H-like nuclease
MGDAQRIRQLASRDFEPDRIAAQLKLRPAAVRRVLGRSAKRGAPRKREATATLSFATTPEIAATVRAVAADQRVSVSSVIDDMVRTALEQQKPIAAPGRRRPRGRTDSKTTISRQGARNALVTAADAPESVRQLLKSYDPKALRWRVRNDRYAIVVAILTRGGEEAMQWLRGVLPHAEVRALVRQYGGSGCAEPDRVKLRKQLRLTTADIPTRPYIGFGTERGHERENS